MMIGKLYTVLVIRYCKISNNGCHLLTIINNNGEIIKI